MDEFIFNQYNIPKDKWRYGLRASAVTGCGWIAAYNALRIMGHKPAPQMLIRSFQRHVPVINGNLGTFLFSPALWFRKRGYRVKTYVLREDFDAAAKNADACILFYRWMGKMSAGAHFVALGYDGENFIGYNVYRNSTGPDHLGKSLSGFLKRRKYFGAILFTITERR